MDVGANPYVRRWAIIRFRLKGPFLVLDYRDNSPGRLRFRHQKIWGAPELSPLVELLEELVGTPIPRLGPHANGPYPVAVYYSLPRGVDLPVLEELFLTWIRELPFFDQLQPVRLSGAPRLRRDLFHLPLRILVQPEALPMAEEFATQWWLRDPRVAEHGIQVQVLDSSKQDLELSLRTGDYAILVTQDPRTAARALRRIPEEARPRLLICTGGPHERVPSIAGVAVLNQGPNPRPGVLTIFLLGVVHDLPLHEALKTAQRWTPGNFDVQLIADPLSNQSLRMREALIAAKRAAFRVRSIATDMRTGGDLGITFLAQPLHWQTVLAIEESTPEQIFFRESTGVVPLAEGAANFQEFWNEQRLETPMAAPGPRALDAALLRLDTEPWYTPVETYQGLQAGASYDLRVHIGSRLPGSVVVGEVSGIDQLIGAPDNESGHVLAISVQPKDFRLEGSGTFQVRLPRTGPTEPVYFRVRAPKERGPAELRIYVHHRNHLVQSFLLNAEIDPEESNFELASNRLSVRQEFAQSEEFTNLDDLRPRALCLGLNSQGTTHQIGIVADSVIDEVNLSATAYEQAVQELRQELKDAILVPGGVRTYTPVPKGQAPGTDAADALRKLARKGSAVYDALLGGVSDAARAALVRVQGCSKQVLQIVRFDPRAAFPWAMLYDWSLPVQRSQAPEPPVCLGYTLDANGLPVECAHNSTDRVICVRGFWGVRHYVEELLPQLRDVQLKIPKPVTDPVRIVASSSLPEARQLENNLKPLIGSNAVAPGPWVEKALLDLLWSSPVTRPAVLVVLGHMQMQDIPSQPTGARVELQPGNEWITLQELRDRVRREPAKWGDPRTILILAPCESAATDDQTLNDFVTTFSRAGAGAILGTQVEVGAAQATDFAQQLTNRLWAGDTLGVAMQEFRAGLVMGGDPGGFLFQSFGHVDLELQ